MKQGLLLERPEVPKNEKVRYHSIWRDLHFVPLENVYVEVPFQIVTLLTQFPI